MKKIILMGVSLALIAALAVSGTLAYLTDRDSEANVFTVGDIKITLIEQYTQGREIMPGKAVPKAVSIKNTGKNNAWVWYTYAVPKALDGYLEIVNEVGTLWDAETLDLIGITEIAGTDYCVYGMLYSGVLAPGDITATGMKSVELKKTVDYDHASGKYFESNQGEVVKWIDFDIAKTVIYVNAYGIQQENIPSALDAYKAYLGQWGTASDNAMLKAENFATVVHNEAELRAALEQGGQIAFAADIRLTGPLTADMNAEVLLNGYKLTVGNTEFTADITISGGTIQSSEKSGGGAPYLMVTSGTLTLEKVDILIDRPVNEMEGFAEYWGIAVDGGDVVLNDTNLTVKNDVPRQFNMVHGVLLNDGSLTATRGKISVSSIAEDSVGSAAAICNTGDNTATLKDTRIDAPLLAFCQGGMLTINTTDRTVDDADCVGGEWVINYIG